MLTAIYKICGRQDWSRAVTDGVYTGSPDDRRDGYIHFSTAAQLAGTLAKHFRGRDDLLLLAVEIASVSPALKWELARGGQLFPHLYGTLDVALVTGARPLELGLDGRHILPRGL